MKVIFTKDVPGVARRYDVKDVSDGYARNYLFLNNYAISATPGALKTREKEAAERQKKHALDLHQAQALKERLENTVLTFSLKMGEGGSAFGSVSAARIHEELAKKGVAVSRDAIELEHPIKSSGSHDVRIRLHPDVNITITVVLEAETSPEKASKSKPSKKKSSA